MYLSGAHSGGMHATRARKRSLPHCYIQSMCMHVLCKPCACTVPRARTCCYAAQNSRKSPSLVVE